MDLWRHGKDGRRAWSPFVYTPTCRQDGPLVAHVLAFSGRMSLPRSEPVQFVNALGGSVGARVTSHTTVLVVAPKPDGSELSLKERQAKKLASLGHPIRLLSEAKFHAWLGLFQESLQPISGARQQGLTNQLH